MTAEVGQDGLQDAEMGIKPLTGDARPIAPNEQRLFPITMFTVVLIVSSCAALEYSVFILNLKFVFLIYCIVCFYSVFSFDCFFPLIVLRLLHFHVTSVVERG